MKLPDYRDKIFLIAKALNIQIETHLKQAIQILSMDWPSDLALEIRILAKKEWKIPYLQGRMKRTPSYRKHYKELQTLLKDF